MADTKTNMKRLMLGINEVDCMLCGVVIESVLMRTPGVQSASVDEKAKRAEVVFDPKAIDSKQIQNKILSLGYRTNLLGESPA
jgi:copper chaperone CopZ